MTPTPATRDLVPGLFTLVLHTHLPWLAHHGRWPVGEEWLYQSWAASYLPLLRVLRRLADENRQRLITLGVTPVVMAQLDDKVRLPIAASMKPAVLSAILGKMGTLEAKDLTEKLAHRFAPMQALAAAAVAPPSAAPAAPAPAKGAKVAKAAPAPAADDATPGDDPAADAAPDVKPKTAKKPAPKHIAKAAPKKPPLPKAKKPVATAKADDAAMPAKPQPYAAVKDKPPAAAAPATPAPTPAKSS